MRGKKNLACSAPSGPGGGGILTPGSTDESDGSGQVSSPFEGGASPTDKNNDEGGSPDNGVLPQE